MENPILECCKEILINRKKFFYNIKLNFQSDLVKILFKYSLHWLEYYLKSSTGCLDRIVKSEF